MTIPLHRTGGRWILRALVVAVLALVVWGRLRSATKPRTTEEDASLTTRESGAGDPRAPADSALAASRSLDSSRGASADAPETDPPAERTPTLSDAQDFHALYRPYADPDSEEILPYETFRGFLQSRELLARDEALSRDLLQALDEIEAGMRSEIVRLREAGKALQQERLAQKLSTGNYIVTAAGEAPNVDWQRGVVAYGGGFGDGKSIQHVALYRDEVPELEIMKSDAIDVMLDAFLEVVFALDGD
jgi:hypothetical protein